MTPVAATDASILIKQGDEVKIEYEMPDKVKAPISKGDVIGKIKITHEGDIPDARAQIAQYLEERRKGREEREHGELFRRLLNGGEA